MGMEDETVMRLQAENETLRRRVAELEATRSCRNGGVDAGVPVELCDSRAQALVNENPSKVDRESLGKAGLTTEEIARYSRHLLVPAVGVAGQRNIMGTTCLVIGAGGLASAVLPYLAGAGVGHIKVIDFDEIETSNLHRQVMYREVQAGRSKARCAAEVVRGINSNVRCTPIEAALTHDNALEVMAGCHLVVDASDNPRTRYLVNDACVLTGKPLVSGSALGMEGQVSVFNLPEGPCYRCIFPVPLAAEAGRRCSDNGVLGTVPGVIGCLQATEALKVLGGFGEPLVGKLCTYDAQDGSFYTVRLKSRSKTCALCGDEPMVVSMKDSEAFASKHGLTVGRRAPDTSEGPDLPTDTCEDYASVVAEGREHLLLDVRVKVQFAVCALDHAVNIPLAELEELFTVYTSQALPPFIENAQWCLVRREVLSWTLQRLGSSAWGAALGKPASGAAASSWGRCCPQEEASLDRVKNLSGQKSLPIYCICRRGIDSRTAVALLLRRGFNTVKDIKGGLTEWSRTVDPRFPMY